MDNIISLDDLLTSLPKSEKTEKVIEDIKAAYWEEFEKMRRYREKGKKIELSIYPFRHTGNQFIANFEVNDRGKPVTPEYNWHLQDTSQWLYAGCILVQEGRVSTHH